MPAALLAVLLLALIPASAEAAVAESTPFDAVGPLSLAGGGEAHASFRLFPFRWSTRRITYYNAAKGNAWSVRKAVRAWNRSGVRVRFVATRRSRARVLIRNFPKARGCLPLGLAPVQYDGRRRVTRAQVLISRQVPKDPACTRWTQAVIVAHELGHVLGLNHETRRCATMNKQMLNLAPEHCAPKPLDLWRWRCRLLEPDDVRGAVRIFGGRVKRRPPPVCDLVGAPGTPQGLTAAPEGSYFLAVRFRRPVDRKHPPHIFGVAQPGYLTAIGKTCAVTPSSGSQTSGASAWTARLGATESARVYTEEQFGRLCVTVWAQDQIGHLSKPATTFVDVPPPPPEEF